MQAFLILLLSSLTYGFPKPPNVIPPKNPFDPPRLPIGVNKNVLIVGGGLAGLSAALELAERGYNVTIKEKFEIGGKLFSKPIEIFPNKTFQIEHGFHAWFNNYHQFYDIRTRLGINGNFQKWDKVHYYFQEYKPEVIYSSGPYPFNLLEIISRSPNLHLTDAIESAIGLPDMLYFDYDTVFDKWDNYTFHEWADIKHIAKDFYDIILQPALSVTLNEKETFSAAEMLTFIQLYFLSDSNADKRETVKSNFYDGILKPWTNRLLTYNTSILLNKTVRSLKVDETSLNAYGSIDEDGDDSTVYDHVIMSSDLGGTQNIIRQTLDTYKNNSKLWKTFGNAYYSKVDKLKIAPLYKVVRMWFDKQLSADIPDIIETPDYGVVNLIAQYSQLEDEFIKWANETGGSVLEFHCYTWTKNFSANVSDDQVWGLISPTVKRILPQLFDRSFQVLAHHVYTFQNFGSFENGSIKYRPDVAYFSTNNIYLAGDWIRTAYPAALMEKAVSTGREAANQILLKDHVQQSTLTVTSSKGPGIL